METVIWLHTSVKKIDLNVGLIEYKKTLDILPLCELTSHNPNNYIIKISNDAAILGLMKKDRDIPEYYWEIQRFVVWSDDNHLVMNVKQTQEMVFNARGVGDHMPVAIHSKTISQISLHKYLGVLVPFT